MKKPTSVPRGKKNRKTREELNQEARERKHQKKHRGHAAGIQTVGVLYGYGSREELESAGADALAETPEALLARLL